MIEGLKIRCSGVELYAILDALVVKHGGKAKVYEEGIDHLNQAKEFGDRNVSGDPIGGMKAKVVEHQNKVEMFTFLRDHVMRDEEYILTQNDMYTLEIMSRY